MMISSIVLFFSRDWAGGAGPTVDVPKLVPEAPAVGAPAVGLVSVVVGADVAVTAVVEVLGADVEGVLPRVGLLAPKRPPVEGAVVLVVAAGAADEDVAENREVDVADVAGAELVAPKSDLDSCAVVGVADEIAVEAGVVVAVEVGAKREPDGCDVDGVVPPNKLDVDAGFAASGLEAALAPKRDVPEVGVALPNSDGWEVVGVEVDGVALDVVFAPKRDVAGFCPKRPPPDCSAGFEPKSPPLDGSAGFEPKSPPPDDSAGF